MFLTRFSPFNNSNKVTLVAGIHSPGTLGAGKFLGEMDNLKAIENRLNNGIADQVIYAEYSKTFDNIVSCGIR